MHQSGRLIYDTQCRGIYVVDSMAWRMTNLTSHSIHKLRRHGEYALRFTPFAVCLAQFRHLVIAVVKEVVVVFYFFCFWGHLDA